MKKKSGQLRFEVIAGELKGRRMVAPDLGVTRPPLSRLRISIFDFLMPRLRGAAYLDLFCGTGSYLFEAVSRGVAEAVGVELESALCDSIGAQAEKYGVADRLTCHCEDVFTAVPRLNREHRRFDIIMIAPPQYRGIVDQTLSLLAARPILSDGGLIVCQHDSSETARIDYSKWAVGQERKYGNTTFSILQE